MLPTSLVAPTWQKAPRKKRERYGGRTHQGHHKEVKQLPRSGVTGDVKPLPAQAGPGLFRRNPWEARDDPIPAAARGIERKEPSSLITPRVGKVLPSPRFVRGGTKAKRGMAED